jgi:hypothetical protein
VKLRRFGVLRTSLTATVHLVDILVRYLPKYLARSCAPPPAGLTLSRLKSGCSAEAHKEFFDVLTTAQPSTDAPIAVVTFAHAASASALAPFPLVHPFSFSREDFFEY